MKESFIAWKPNKKTIALLQDIMTILNQYAEMDIRLTLRQLYYQLVSQNIIANTKAQYSKLSTILAKARLVGIVDWTAIEDRIRQPQKHSEWDNIQELVKSAIYSYRLPRWKGQEKYIELWCEKDALSSVLQPITDEFHITLMINRGYSSCSAMYDARNRFLKEPSKGCTIFYLGDFDPSGEDMVRDIQNRLNNTFDIEVNVIKIALTERQISKYKLPPNPAKLTDPHSQEFIEQHGNESYEVDALPPKVLMSLVRKSIEAEMDIEKYEKIVSQENVEKKRLTALAREIR